MKEVVSVLVYYIEGIAFAIPAHTVKQVIRMVEITPLPFVSDTIMGLINYYGEIVPVINMRKVFGLPQRDIELEDCLIVARTSRRTLALWADAVKGLEVYDGSELIEEQNYILPEERQRKAVVGCVRLEGGLILVHDIEALITNKDEDKLRQLIGHEPTATQ